MSSQANVAAAIVAAGRRLHERRILASYEGNLSVKVGSDRLLTTATGKHKGRLLDADLVLVDLSGEPLSGGTPSSELKLHLAIYEERPEVRAVVHAHPPIATGYAVAGKQPPTALAEMVTFLGCIPVAPYGTPSTTALANSVRAPIRDFDVVLLANHGAVTVGASLEEAEERMVQLEHFAQIALVAHLLGGPRHFSREEIEELSGLRQAAGHLPVPEICYPSTDESGTMIVGRVVDNVVTTQKHSQSRDTRLLLVQPLGRGGDNSGTEIMVADSVGARAGETVLVAIEGGSVTPKVGIELAPANAAIIGIINQIDWGS